MDFQTTLTVLISVAADKINSVAAEGIVLTDDDYMCFMQSSNEVNYFSFSKGLKDEPSLSIEAVTYAEMHSKEPDAFIQYFFTVHCLSFQKLVPSSDIIRYLVYLNSKNSNAVLLHPSGYCSLDLILKNAAQSSAVTVQKPAVPKPAVPFSVRFCDATVTDNADESSVDSLSFGDLCSQLLTKSKSLVESQTSSNQESSDFTDIVKNNQTLSLGNVGLESEPSVENNLDDNKSNSNFTNERGLVMSNSSDKEVKKVETESSVPATDFNALMDGFSDDTSVVSESKPAVNSTPESEKNSFSEIVLPNGEKLRGFDAPPEDTESKARVLFPNGSANSNSGPSPIPAAENVPVVNSTAMPVTPQVPVSESVVENVVPLPNQNMPVQPVIYENGFVQNPNVTSVYPQSSVPVQMQMPGSVPNQQSVTPVNMTSAQSQMYGGNMSVPVQPQMYSGNVYGNIMPQMNMGVPQSVPLANVPVGVQGYPNPQMQGVGVYSVPNSSVYVNPDVPVQTGSPVNSGGIPPQYSMPVPNQSQVYPTNVPPVQNQAVYVNPVQTQPSVTYPDVGLNSMYLTTAPIPPQQSVYVQQQSVRVVDTQRPKSSDNGATMLNARLAVVLSDDDEDALDVALSKVKRGKADFKSDSKKKSFFGRNK